MLRYSGSCLEKNTCRHSWMVQYLLLLTEGGCQLGGGEETLDPYGGIFHGWQPFPQAKLQFMDP